jgi:hypothetical protein
MRGTPLLVPNAFVSESCGKVSISTAMVCPFPLNPTASALYAINTSGTLYGGAFPVAGAGYHHRRGGIRRAGDPGRSIAMRYLWRAARGRFPPQEAPVV